MKDMSEYLLKKGIEALKTGNKKEAKDSFEKILRTDPNNEEAWLWMSGAVSTDEERSTCLENVLVINPHNMAAKKEYNSKADNGNSRDGHESLRREHHIGRRTDHNDRKSRRRRHSNLEPDVRYEERGNGQDADGYGHGNRRQ